MVDSTANDNGNGKVTLAILGEQMRRVDEKLTEVRDETRRFHSDQEERLRKVEALTTRHEQQITDIGKDVQDNCTDINVLKSSDRKWGGVAILISAAIAGLGQFFGGK